MTAMPDADRLPTIGPALRVAAARFGSPLFVTDAAALEDAASELRAAFPDPWLRQFSVKANDVAAIVARLGSLGLGANVVSRGEWAVARRAGIPNARTTLEGVGKTDADLGAAVRAAAAGDPLRWVAVESTDEASVLGRLARRARVRLDVLLRFNPSVEPETLSDLAVGAGSSKFGLADDELAAAVEAGGGADGPLRWRGLHLHVGSQLGAVDAWRDAVRRALALGALLGGGLPNFDTLDVGGGFPVGPADAAPRPERFARELPALFAAVPPGRVPVRLGIEPGRFLVARAGWLVGSVLHVRERGGRMVVLDTGMTELIRPALYGADHPIVALTSLGRPVDPAAVAEPPDGSSELVDVHGPICESTDALGSHVLPPLRRGDLVAIRDAGAYGAALGSTYNGRPRPPQVILETDGRLTLARRRGSLAALG